MTMKKFVALLVTLMMVFSFASLSLAETKTPVSYTHLTLPTKA